MLFRSDVILLTHNHYDHMDVAVLARLWQRDKPRIVTPLGNDTILRADAADGIAEGRVVRRRDLARLEDRLASIEEASFGERPRRLR